MFKQISPAPRAKRSNGAPLAAMFVVPAAVVIGVAWYGLQRRPSSTLPSDTVASKGETVGPRVAPPWLAPGPAGSALAMADAEAPPTEATRDPDEVPAWSPFARFERTRDERKVLYDAEEIAVASCMKAKGFEYQTHVFGAGSDLSQKLPRYRPGDKDIAGSIGYGLAESLEVGEIPLVADVNEDKVKTMTPERQRAWAEALHGPPPPLRNEKASNDPNWVLVPTGMGPTMRWYKDACFSQARRAVQGDEAAYVREEAQVRSLAIEAQRKAQEDPEYQSGLKVWRTCMAQKGFTYDDSQAAAGALQSELETGKITLDQLRAREIEIASADAGCHEEAHLKGMEDAARARAEGEVADRNRSILEGFEKIQREALERARRLVQSHAPQGETRPTSG